MKSEELEQLASSLREIVTAVRRIHPEAATPITVEHLKALVVKLSANCEQTARVLVDITNRMAKLEETLANVRHHPRRPDSSGNPEG